jgi:hypothetical protein
MGGKKEDLDGVYITDFVELDNSVNVKDEGGEEPNAAKRMKATVKMIIGPRGMTFTFGHLAPREILHIKIRLGSRSGP